MDKETYIAQVRALTGDDNIADPTFTNVQIEALMGLYESPYGAAINLLERLAVEEALTYKYVKSYDIIIDGTKVPKDIILERTKRLREEYNDLQASALSDAFVIVDTPEHKRLEFSEGWFW